MEKKVCKECSCLKPISEFYAHKEMKDGYLNFCKACFRKRRIEKIRAYDRQRGCRTSIHDLHKYRVGHPIRYKATNAVNNAIRDGRLKKEACVICGCEESVHGHHPDYSKPLEVIWLCPVHHAEFDGRTIH